MLLIYKIIIYYYLFNEHRVEAKQRFFCRIMLEEYTLVCCRFYQLQDTDSIENRISMIWRCWKTWYWKLERDWKLIASDGNFVKKRRLKMSFPSSLGAWTRRNKRTEREEEKNRHERSVEFFSLIRLSALFHSWRARTSARTSGGRSWIFTQPTAVAVRSRLPLYVRFLLAVAW